MTAAVDAATLTALRARAEAANPDHDRPWEWQGVGEHGYPQQIIRIGDAALIAEAYEGPDHPSSIAEFIATFDPPTVLALLAAAEAGIEDRATIERVEALADEWRCDCDPGPDGYPHRAWCQSYPGQMLRAALVPRGTDDRSEM